MKKLVVAMLYAFCAITAVHSGDISAQTGAGTSTTTTSSGTTPNLITSGTNHTWYGVQTGALPVDRMPGGPTPLYDPSTNTISFSYNASASVGQVMAINQALANVGAGVKINGYNYSYDVRNMNGDDRQGGIDTFTISQLLRGQNNSVLLSSSQYYNTKFEWKTVTGTKTATTPYNIADTTYLQFGIQGGDNGYWGGYFGPQVRNVNMSLNYAAAPVTQHTMGDDGYVNIPLQFGFPFYGKVFTNSFMFDNGVVGFFDPVAGGCNPANGYCGGQQWNAQPFSNNMGNQFSYMIAPLWADLAPNANTKYLTQGDATYQKYTWENIGQYYDQSKLQTFDLTIKPSGFIGVNYGAVNLNQTNIGIGTIGNPSLGEYTQIGFHNAGTTVTGIPNWTMDQTQAVDICTTNPLSSPACPNYATAYLSQQCSISSLYNSSCPGYTSAYLTQQCTANQMYSTSCPGYASAYLDYQCSVDPLYSTTCQGYTTAYHDQQCSINPLYATDCTGYTTAYHDQQCSANPLYATDCTGYASAYLTQQCSANPLYSTQCSGYAAAYKTQQCSASALYATDCPGYATAFKTQQCSISALYATDCPGYAVAYKTQQCTASPLYATDCPGYAEAYLNSQCIKDSLYSNKCEGYATAYAIKNLVVFADSTVSSSVNGALSDTAATKANDPANTVVSTTAASTTVSSDGTVSTGVSTTGDTNIDKAIAVKTTSATGASPAAAVQLTAPPPAAAPMMAERKQEDKKGENKPEGDKGGDKPAGGSGQTAQGNDKGGDKPAAPTARQALAERRQEAARAKAVETGKNLANEMGKAADMESQKAIQNVVIQAMGFTPGFDAYNKAMIPDTTFYRPYSVYGNQRNVDNQNVSRRLMGGSDRTHQEMVDSQFQLGK